MATKKKQTQNPVDQYIAGFSGEVRAQLETIRTIIQKAAPKADELISYGMPAYKTNGKPLVYFAGYKNHIGFYATPTGHAEFANELSKYKQGKGSVQFPITETIPYELVIRIVQFRMKENEQK